MAPPSWFHVRLYVYVCTCVCPCECCVSTCVGFMCVPVPACVQVCVCFYVCFCTSGGAVCVPVCGEVCVCVFVCTRLCVRVCVQLPVLTAAEVLASRELFPHTWSPPPIVGVPQFAPPALLPARSPSLSPHFGVYKCREGEHVVFSLPGYDPENLLLTATVLQFPAHGTLYQVCAHVCIPCSFPPFSPLFCSFLSLYSPSSLPSPPFQSPSLFQFYRHIFLLACPL